MDEFKNALPEEVDDHPDSGMPRQLRTQADSEEPLSPEEARVAGITPDTRGIYGESSEEPNEEDQRDVHGG
jgi:hypothetical protein